MRIKVSKNTAVYIFTGFILCNCTIPPPVQPETQESDTPAVSESVKPGISTEIVPVVNTSDDRSQITFVMPAEINAEHLLFIEKSLQEISNKSVKHLLADSVQDDSLSVLIARMVFNEFSSNFHYYEFLSATASGDSLFINYRLNKTLTEHIIKPYLDTYGYPAQQSITPLFTTHHNPPMLESVSELKLMLPCAGSSVPTQALLLPNAPRKYRHGIHRGIDFVVDWGTPVMAVADGIVIRADHYYEEFLPHFREQLLAEAKKLGHTPSDVFEHVLVGQAIYIDHGFELVPGYRALSIYAHLSYIQPGIKPGQFIRAGQLLGQSGNSGTEDGTLGKRTGAHLHWELILQDAGGEYYFGQGWDTDKLYQELVRVFSE